MNLQTVLTVVLAVIFTASGTYTAMDVTEKKNSQRINKTVKVEKVVDGDTVDISLDGKRKTVRILGIDTPETTRENNPSEYYLEDIERSRNCLSSKARVAKNYLRKKIGKKTVKLVQDPEGDKVGSYGRLLGYIKYNNTDLGRKMLENGYARFYDSKFVLNQDYREMEALSRRKGVGIWNESCGVQQNRE